MGRAPCCSKVGLLRGPWSAEEDALLINYIQAHGEGQWRSLPKRAGLLRCGKSCRLRWVNYLRPGIKRGNITPDEDDLIIRLHSLLGNRWSLIAKIIPGRTDNEIKNHWNSHLSKRLKVSHTKLTKSNIKTTAEKKQKNKIDKPATTIGTTVNNKVHQPKASRVSPFSVIRKNGSFDDSIVVNSGSSSRGSEESKLGVFDFLSDIWTDINAGASANYCYSGKEMVIDEDQEFDYNYGFDTAAYLNVAPIGLGGDDSNMLDHIFEEYQQLLN